MQENCIWYVLYKRPRQSHSRRPGAFDASCDFLSIAPELAWVVDLAKARGPQYCVKAPQPRPHSGKYHTALVIQSGGAP